MTKTSVIHVGTTDMNSLHNTLRRAAGIIRLGGLVAFPTETVYGLGANAFDRLAVSRIYAVKGRPQDNPLIMHVSSVAEAERLTVGFTEGVRRLTAVYWPGPLTVVCKKSGKLPDWINNGMDTVAIRMPSNPIAAALIWLSECVIAAPSANLSGRPSPTQASHVAEDLSGKIDMLIDGGATGGIESTVVDMTGDTPRILRPGVVTAEMLAEALGIPADAVGFFSNQTQAPKSPGMKYTHYAPRGKMTVVMGKPDAVAEWMSNTAYYKRHPPGSVFGFMATGQTVKCMVRNGKWSQADIGGDMPVWRNIGAGASDGKKGISIYLLNIGDRNNPLSIAHNIYAALRLLDTYGASVIYAEGVPSQGVGIAVMNRLGKASGGQIVKLGEV